jgi:hypothetical protein
MSEIFLRKYGVASTINFALYKTDASELKVDAVCATSDAKIMKDEGAEANCTNNFADEGQGYSLVNSAGEMSAARIMIYLVDQTSPKAWLDKAIIIETYGNASGQHAFDLDAANLSTGDLDDALTDWNKSSFALTTAQHDLIGAAVSTAKLDAAASASTGCTLSTSDLDDALTVWNKSSFALTTAQHDLIGARVSTAKLDAAASASTGGLTTTQLDAGLAAGITTVCTLTTSDLDDALTAWNKSSFALTTAQHDLIGARISTAKLDAAASASTGGLTTTQLDAGITGLSTLDTGDLDGTVTAIFTKGMETHGGANSDTMTFGEQQRIMFSVLAGPSTGGGGSTLSYLSADGVTTRVKAVASTDGDRSTIVYAGSS